MFGWNIKTRDDGAVAFDGGVGQVSGRRVTGRDAMADAGILIYVMGDDLVAILAAIVAKGGTIAKQIGKAAPELTARFRDPAGNLFGLYQEGGRS